MRSSRRSRRRPPIPEQLTRRELVARSARAGAALTLLTSPFVRAPSAVAGATFLRRDLGNLDASSPTIASYARAVATMKGLPALDPLSWWYQAAIHGIDSDEQRPGWNTCEHGSTGFWSWHRMYLHYFERIVRRFSGVPSFALPYWNYESASQRSLPPMFRDESSPLYDATRGGSWNDGSYSLPDAAVRIEGGLVPTEFTTASLALETTPHNAVHGLFGGNMQVVPKAALDPIFFVHHANVDRFWEIWLAQGNGRADPVNDVAWTTREYTFFDENRNQVTMTGHDVICAASQLHYAYEGYSGPAACLPVEPGSFTEKNVFPWPGPNVIAEKAHIVRGVIRTVRPQLAAAADSPSETLLVRLEGVVAADAPKAIWEVYLSPPGVTELRPSGPYFLGTVALFGAGIRSEGHRFMPASIVFPADRAVRASLHGETEELALTFRAIGPLLHGKPTKPHVASPVRIAKATMVVQTRRRG